LDGNIDH